MTSERESTVLFMPLGGGQSIGASCYFLQFGNHAVILDAGAGTRNGIVYGPVLSELLKLKGIYSLNQISGIIVSHAHYDHSGFLPVLMSEAKNAPVYMTEITRSLTELQLYDRLRRAGSEASFENKRISTRCCLDRVTEVSFMQTLYFSDYSITFLPAGHIPGAMMTLIEYRDRKILYTGDYAADGSPLCPGCYIPDDIRPDTLIMCGVHAGRPDRRRYGDELFNQIYDMLSDVRAGCGPVMCTVSQLSKGAELLKMINDYNRYHIPVFVDRQVMQVVQKLERSGIRIMTKDNRIMTGTPPSYSHIFISSGGRKCRNSIYTRKYSIDFSLHDDFHQTKQFIDRIKPEKTVIVHCSGGEYGYSALRKPAEDGGTGTEIIFGKEQQLYQL